MLPWVLDIDQAMRPTIVPQKARKERANGNCIFSGGTKRIKRM